MTEKVNIGVIGGSGLYEVEALSDVSHIRLDTPFGKPSDDYIIGTLNDTRVAFLPRHGRGHFITPSELNFRANIYGFKSLGVESIIAVSAVGSLKEQLHPTDIVIPDQFYDRTKERVSTFFGDGLVAHVAFADPVCSQLAKLIHETSIECGAVTHKGGTLLCIEGPAFSTRAESNVYRQWGMDIIGMTSLQEAKLAREAEICYSIMAMVTDYDCWHEDESEVTVEAVVQNLKKNISKAKEILEKVIPKASSFNECSCRHSLETAIMTDSAAIPETTKERLKLIVGKYLE